MVYYCRLRRQIAKLYTALHLVRYLHNAIFETTMLCPHLTGTQNRAESVVQIPISTSVSLVRTLVLNSLPRNETTNRNHLRTAPVEQQRRQALPHAPYSERTRSAHSKSRVDLLTTQAKQYLSMSCFEVYTQLVRVMLDAHTHTKWNQGGTTPTKERRKMHHTTARGGTETGEHAMPRDQTPQQP